MIFRAGQGLGEKKGKLVLLSFLLVVVSKQGHGWDEKIFQNRFDIYELLTFNELKNIISILD